MPVWKVHFSLTLRDIDRQVVADVAQVHALARVIRGIPIPPRVQQRLDRLNILRAVRGTTGIEGTELSEDEVVRVVDAQPEDAPLGPGREREEQEVRNAEALMQFVGNYARQNLGAPLSESMVMRFHSILTQGINYQHNEPGQYRSHAVNVGNYRPPPTREEVEMLMNEFFRWFNTGLATQWDPVLRAIVAHFYVVSIHPFGDGNGRTSRAVESYLLYQAGVNVRGYYSLANYYYRNRSEYIHNLNLIQMQGGTDLTPFVAFSLKGLVQELEVVHAEVLEEVRVIAFRDFARENLTAANKLGTPAGERQLRFLIGLGDQAISQKKLRAGELLLSGLYRSVTSRTLSRDINVLKEQNLIIVDGDELRANLELMTQFIA